MPTNPDSISHTNDILVVDDEVSSLRLLTEILEKDGYKVRPSESPLMAIESAMAYPPDLILLDVKMPEMSGYEVCRLLKQDERTSSIPVIFVSALQDVQAKIKGFETGGVDFVSKPYQELEVLARVQTHLSVRNMLLHMEYLVADRTAELENEIVEHRKSEENYRSIFDAANDAIFIHDIENGSVVDVNLRALRMYGIDNKNDIVGTLVGGLSSGVKPYTFEDAGKWIERAKKKGPQLFEWHAKDSKGQLFWVEVNLKQADISGKNRILAIVRDISERKKAEEALHDSEEKFRNMVEQSPLSIQILNLDGQILQVNKAWQELWGISDEGLPEVLKEYNVLEDEEARKLGIIPLIKKAFKGEIVTLPVIEYDALKTMENIGIGVVEANKRWIQARLYSVRNNKNEIINIILIEEDITERRQAEQKLNNYQQRLKALASQLTITEERERRRLAVDLHDQIGQTLAFARMQLASAQKAASDIGLKEKLSEISGSMLKAVQDTRHIIYDLSPPQMNEVGLTAAIADWLEVQVEKKYGLETELIVEGQKKKLDNDLRAILFRNIRELLTNAIKYAKGTKITVTVKSEEIYLTVIVQDNGVGFDPGALPQNIKNQGGFGLFSIQERIFDMGGTFEIESEPGKGCRAVMTVLVNN